MDCFQFRLFHEDAGWMILFWWRSINVYKAVVLTTLLYGAESWITYRPHLHLVERYHQRCLRAILNSIGMISSSTLRSLKWLRLPALRPCSLKHSFAEQDMSPGRKTIAYQRWYYNIYRELSTGHRDKGTPRKIYKVTLERSLATCSIYYHQWTTQVTMQSHELETHRLPGHHLL